MNIVFTLYAFNFGIFNFCISIDYDSSFVLIYQDTGLKKPIKNIPGYKHKKRCKDNNEDQLILEQWKEKNTKFYDNAITTWTIRDINKRKIAKENNLNYIEFWNINELKDWLKIDSK